MFKFNKKKILNFNDKNETSLLKYISKEEKEKIRIKKIKQRVSIKKIKDINGMEISYNVIKNKN